MTDIGHNSTAARIRSIVEQVEAARERIASENAHISDIYKAAKSDGLPVKGIKAVIAERAKDPAAVREITDEAEMVRAVLGDAA